MGYLECSESSDAESSTAWALTEFASCCCAPEGNLAYTVCEKILCRTLSSSVGRKSEVAGYSSRGLVCTKRYFTGPCGGGNPLPSSLTSVLSHGSDGGVSIHPLMGSGGEGVMAVSVFEIFPVCTVGRDVRRRFLGGTCIA